MRENKSIRIRDFRRDGIKLSERFGSLLYMIVVKLMWLDEFF